uniref:Src like adaptor n=1 Tax=Pygocentrus nattereri TaxID=42514 RepID=A0A3B4DEH3_PYGNA
MVLEDSEYDSVFEAEVTEDNVETPFGTVHCSMTGIPKENRPVILTFHDIGLNYKTCFDGFFSHEDMQEITRHFAVCHVNAPGQQECASTLPTGYIFFFKKIYFLSASIKSVIGLAIGAGAYILARFALNHPDLVEGLVLINVNAQAEGWMDWATHKFSGLTHAVPDMVISHLFGKEEIHNNHDLIATFRHHITTRINQTNLQHFVKSYNSRRHLDIERPSAGGTVNVKTLKCPALLVVGDSSPAVDAVVDCNSKMNPTKTTFLKMADCGGLPQVDQPAKLAEAFKYFIQGLGYSNITSSCLSAFLFVSVSSAGMTRLSRSRTASGNSVSSLDASRLRTRNRTHTGEGQRGRSHTDVSMESASNSSVEPVLPATIHSTEVSC